METDSSSPLVSSSGDMDQKKAVALSGLAAGFIFLAALAFHAPFPAGSEAAEQSFAVDSFTVETRTRNGTVTGAQYSEYGGLAVGIRAHDHGHLQILVPAGMLDSCRKDLPFAGYVVWVEGEEVVPEETEPGLLGIEFAPDTRRIEIAGTCYLNP